MGSETHFDGRPAAVVGPEIFSPELKGLLAYMGISVIVSPTVPPGTAFVLPYGVPHWHPRPGDVSLDKENHRAGEAQAQETDPEA